MFKKLLESSYRITILWHNLPLLLTTYLTLCAAITSLPLDRGIESWPTFGGGNWTQGYFGCLPVNGYSGNFWPAACTRNSVSKEDHRSEYTKEQRVYRGESLMHNKPGTGTTKGSKVRMSIWQYWFLSCTMEMQFNMQFWMKINEWLIHRSSSYCSVCSNFAAQMPRWGGSA